MTKEECMQHFFDSKGRCHIHCKDCYFAGTQSTTNDCYANRFSRFLLNPKFRYRFALHYFNRKIKKMKEILS